MSDKTYVFEPTSNGQMDAATAALLGNRNNGGLFGSNGIEGLIGLIIAAGIFGGGNGNGWFGGGGNNNTEREMLMQAISRNGNDINSLASQFNCSTGQVMAAINALSGAICNLGNQTGQNTNQIIMAILQGNNAITSQLADCCCSTKQLISQGFSDLGYATRDQTCSIEKAIANSTSQILEGQRASEMRNLQDKLDALREKNSQQATAINNYQQTQTFGAMLSPISNAIGALQSDIDGIKCRLPKTEVITAQPDYVPINRGINLNYAAVPSCGFSGFGFGNWGWNGFNNNGSFF